MIKNIILRSIDSMKMSNVERRDRELVYISDDEVFEEQKITRRLTQELNTVDRSDFASIKRIVNELLGKSDGEAFINPPFYCDYGTHIHVGKNFFANFNCTIIDVAPVVIGDNCQMAPNVAIYTAGHPVHPAARNTAYEYGIGVTIGHNVWIGGNSVILPGVHIGDGAIIGANAVVGSNVEAYSVVVGNPARVIRKRFDDELIGLLEKFKWWDKPVEEIDSLIPILTSGNLEMVRAELKKRLGM